MICQSCGKEFAKTHNRGRPALRCLDCRGQEKRYAPRPIKVKEPKPPKKAKLSPAARIDRLEIMLKAHGLHISQQAGETMIWGKWYVIKRTVSREGNTIHNSVFAGPFDTNEEAHAVADENPDTDDEWYIVADEGACAQNYWL